MYFPDNLFSKISFFLLLFVFQTYREIYGDNNCYNMGLAAMPAIQFLHLVAENNNLEVRSHNLILYNVPLYWFKEGQLFCGTPCTVGCVILTENQNFDFGIWNQVVLMYDKEAPKVKNVFFLFLAALFSPWISATPFITQKKFRAVYRVHGTQNDGLELTVSMQKSVLKNLHRVLRNQPKCPKIYRFGLATWFLACFA